MRAILADFLTGVLVFCTLACVFFLLLAMAQVGRNSIEHLGQVGAMRALGYFLSACAFGLALHELDGAINWLDGYIVPDVDVNDQEEF